MPGAAYSGPVQFSRMNPARPEYKEALRLKAVTTWLALGNMTQVAVVCEIPYNTLLYWRKQPWWAAMERDIAAGKKVARGAQLDTILDKALEVINDRLVNGDIVLNNKTGELVRKGVSLRDVSSATSSLMQRAAVLEKLRQNEGTKQDTETIKEQLTNLALEFAKMNKPSIAGATTIEFTEKEPDNALHEERETRLQEGSEGIYLEAGSGEEEGRTEQSTGPDGESWESA